MIMNALNEVWSDSYILQVIIQQEFQSLTKILLETLILKTQGFLSKLDMLTKLKEERIVLELVFFGYKNNEQYPIYVSKNTFKRHFDLLLIQEEAKRLYVLIKDFNIFMNDHTFHNGRKHFSRYCLQ